MPEPVRWNRSIVALVIAIFCSAAASLVGITALGKQIYDLTHEEIHLGFLGLAEFAPSALLVLVTGSIADRFRRARVAAVSATVQAASAAGLALYAMSDPTAVGPLFALALVFGTGRAFLAPSNRALPADVVAPEDVPWLMTRRAVSWQTAVIVGPVLGGFLYAIEPAAAYVAMALLLVTAASALLLVRTRPRTGAPPGRGLREAFEGLRFIRRSPVLFGAISLDLFAVLFGGAVALLPAIAEDRLGVGAVGLGWLRGAGGIGAAVTTLLLTRRPITRQVGRALIAAVASFGAFTILLGSTRIYAVAFLAMAALSGADSVSVVVRSTLVPLSTPSSKRGRVSAVESVFIGASNELGAFESGVAGQFLGSGPAVVLGGAATLLVAGTSWFVFPGLRNVDRFPRPASEPDGEPRR